MSQFASSGAQQFASFDVAGAGDKELVAAVDGKRTIDVTPANVEIGDIFTLTIGENSVTFTATGGTVANVTAGLEAAWNNSVSPEFTPFTATDNTTKLTIKADAAEVDFAEGPVATTTDGGGTDNQTLTIADVALAGKAKKIRVLSLLGYTNGASDLRFESGAGGTALTGVMNRAANEEVRYDFSEAGHFETAAGAALSLELAGAGSDFAGSLVYQLVL